MGDGLIRIVLADDHTILREALREILDSEPDFVVVGEAHDGEHATALVTARRPDVMLLDVRMPGMGATRTVSRLLAAAPRTRIIVLSKYECPDSVQELLDMGVCGYLHRSVSRAHLVAAIRGVMQSGDGVFLSLSRRRFTAFDGPQGGDGGSRGALSDRERELLRLVAGALSNRQIALQLEIAEGTVKRHLRNIFRKLDAVSRIDAVNKAIAAALIPTPESRWERSHAGPRRTYRPFID